MHSLYIHLLICELVYLILKTILFFFVFKGVVAFLSQDRRAEYISPITSPPPPPPPPRNKKIKKISTWNCFNRSVQYVITILVSGCNILPGKELDQLSSQLTIFYGTEYRWHKIAFYVW